MSPSVDPDSIPGRTVTECPSDTAVPALVHGEWRERWPGLVHGLTHPGPGREWDFRLFGGAAPDAPARWQRLAPAMGCTSTIHGRQTHGTAVCLHGPTPPGVHLGEAVDAHATRARGLLLAVTVADCVPVFLVAPARGALALVHAGWRGAADGILGGAVATLRDRFGVDPGEVEAHLGPAICGDCYEVGPEVHERLGEPVPAGPTPVDLRGNLARRARGAGIPESQITRSTLCTLCGPQDLYSHRRGDAGRQVAFLGWA